MSLITPENESGDPDTDLVRVKRHLNRAIGVFQNMTREVEQGNFVPEKEVVAEIRTGS